MAFRVLKASYDLVTRLPVFGFAVRRRIVAADLRADEFRRQKQLDRARVELENALVLVGRLPEAQQKNSGIFGHLLGQLGSILRDLDRWEESKDVLREATQEIRRLAEKNPTRYLPMHAMYLVSFGNTLTDLEEYSDAREKYEQALEIQRQMVDDYGEYFEPQLAKTLRSHGGMLLKCGNYDASKAAYREALALLNSDLESGSGKNRELVASIYMGLSIVALENGDLQEAYSACLESVKIRRAIGDPSELAESLQNLAEIENRLDLMELSIEHIQEAVDILEEGSRQSPEVYLPLLASSLNNQGNNLIRDKRYSEAEASHLRAIQILRDLAHSLPSTHLKSLASTLTNYGSLKQEMGQLAAAQEILEEALELYEQSSESREDAVCPDLARTLYNLGNAYCQQCQFEAGRAMYARAAKIQEELALLQPHLFESKLAKTLCSLGIVLNLLGDNEQSKIVFERALTFNRKNARSGRCTDLEAVSITLCNYGSTLSSLGEIDLEIKCVEEAIQYERRLTSMRPEEYWPGLAANLHNLGCVLASRCANPDDMRRAIEALSEAVSIRSNPVADQHASLAGELASSQRELGKLLVQIGEIEIGLESVRAAAEVYERLSKSEPDLFVKDRIEAYGFLGNGMLDKYLSLGNREDLDDAHKWLSKAALLSESLRFRFVNPTQRRKHSEKDLQRILDSLITSCVEIGLLESKNTDTLEEAVTYSEQGRMRAFLDLLKADLEPRNTPDELVGKLHRVPSVPIYVRQLPPLLLQ